MLLRSNQLLRILCTAHVLAVLLPAAAARAAEPAEAAAVRVVLVPVKQGNRESSFGADPARFRETEVFKAAAKAGADIEAPPDPKLVCSFRNGQFFHLFYNTLENLPSGGYVVQRIKKTERFFPANGPMQEKIGYQVEALKERGGGLKRPDQHYGHYMLRQFERRTIVKESEVGIATIDGVGKDEAWPFDPKILFKVVQPYAPQPGVYDQVRFVAHARWTLRAEFDRGGRFSLTCKELGIDINDQAKPAAAASAPQVP